MKYDAIIFFGVKFKTDKNYAVNSNNQLNTLALKILNEKKKLY